MRPGPRREAVFFAAGLLATAAQVLLLRELIVDVAGDEAAVGIGLAAWFAGVGAGASLARRRPAPRADREAAVLVGLLAVLPAAALVAGRLLRAALAPSAGELPGAGLTLALALVTLAPAGAAVGGAFTVLATAASATWRPGEAVARLYVVESIGSLAGGVIVTLLAGRMLPLLLALILGAGAAGLALAGTRAGRRQLAVAAAVCVAGLPAARPLDRWSEAVRFAATAGGLTLQGVADTPYQHLATGGDDVHHLYASGQYVASFPDPYSAEGLGHLLALLAPVPRRVLLLGGIERGLVPVLLRHPVASLTLLEPDPGALAFLEPHLPAADRAALGDARVLVVTGDPRQWLRRSLEPFDLVVLLGPDPATLWRARLATVEFFRLVASRLGRDGVLVTSLPSAPTVLTGETEALAGALVRTLREAFPVVRATPGPDALAVAGRNAAAVTLDPEVLSARWRERGISSPSFDAALLPALLPPERVAQQEAALAAAAERAPLSRDDRPASFLHALARRQQVLAGGLGRLMSLALGMPPIALALLAFLPSALAAWRMRAAGAAGSARTAATHAVAVTGAAGLGWSLILLFSFQTHAGALYGLLGALVAVFMAGLAIGGRLAPHALLVEPIDVDQLPAATRMLRVWLSAAVVFSASLPLTLAAAARASRESTIAAFAAHAALLLAAGLVTGGLFPLAVEVRLASGERVAEAAGRIEAADHLGAALAALSGAVLFLPLLGLLRSSLLLAGLLAVAAVLAARAERGNG
ncbi:MAG: hypothetical protein ACM3PV_05095 [Betaproteobacteria bacterium]